MRQLTICLPPTTLWLGLLLVIVPPAAHAYVGPGLGLGALVVILGIVISVVIAVITIVWYPIKRRLSARSKAAADDDG